MNDNNIKTPLDPSGDFAEMINDTSGLTGITTNNMSHTPPAVATNSNVGASSNKRFEDNEDIAEGNLESSPPNKKNWPTSQNNQESTTYLQNETLNQAYADNVKGEQSISGSAPDPASDDDVLQNAQDMGLASGEDEEHPKELDLGGVM